jgi:hypothetical protein
MLTHEELLEELRYDPDTGEFWWRISKRGRRCKSPAGTLMSTGYHRIMVNGTEYLAHRLAWFYSHAEWPTEIDHINGVTSDNRLVNLRPADRTEQRRNSTQRQDSTSPFKGVTRSGDRWYARIMHDGRHHYLGRFDTPEEARDAYAEAADRLFGEFARSN